MFNAETTARQLINLLNGNTSLKLSARTKRAFDAFGQAQAYRPEPVVAPAFEDIDFDNFDEEVFSLAADLAAYDKAQQAYNALMRRVGTEVIQAVRADLDDIVTQLSAEFDKHAKVYTDAAVTLPVDLNPVTIATKPKLAPAYSKCVEAAAAMREIEQVYRALLHTYDRQALAAPDPLKFSAPHTPLDMYRIKAKSFARGTDAVSEDTTVPSRIDQAINGSYLIAVHRGVELKLNTPAEIRELAAQL